MHIVVLALAIRALPETDVDIGVAPNAEGSVPLVVASDELLLLLAATSVPLGITGGVQVSLDVEVVLEDGVGPSASHSEAGIVVALGVVDLWVLVGRVSKGIVTGAPAIVLQSEVLEVFTGLSA